MDTTEPAASNSAVNRHPYTANGEGQGGSERVSRSRTHVIEAASVCVLMLIVWILLLLPIIFYHLPVAIVSTDLGVSSGFHLGFFVWGEDCVQRSIVCEACKVFDVPYAHF